MLADPMISVRRFFERPDPENTMSELGGASDFVREYTLASGGPYCDCGYKKKAWYVDFILSVLDLCRRLIVNSRCGTGKKCMYLCDPVWFGRFKDWKVDYQGVWYIL